MLRRRAVRDLSGHNAPGAVAVMRGVSFMPRRDAPLWEQRLDLSLARAEASLLRTPSALALSGEAAALVQGLWVRASEPDITVIVPRRSGHTKVALAEGTHVEQGRRTDVPWRRGAVLRRSVVPLEPDEVIERGGLRVTSPMRTGVDCAFDLPARESITILDSAMRVLVDPDRRRPEQAEQRWAGVRAELLSKVEAQRGRRGAVRARAVAAVASPFSESPGESLLRWQVLALGLPKPALQARVDDDERLRSYYLDLAWPELRLTLEYDGRGKYGALGDAWEEKERQDAIHAKGWTFRRFTSRHLADRRLLERDVLAAFPREVRVSARPVHALLV